ncbi:hypothetical protein HYS50_01735 [Candidatus Woesearchaeota archaeon]|nr:hypothetical protein [Candidatus Woesearchaeota archaeon]
MAPTKRGKTSRHLETYRPVSHPRAPPHHPSLDVHSHRTHHLLYLITFLLIVLILIVFFSFPLVYTPSRDEQPLPSSSLSIDAVSCQWKDTQYELCETVSWSGNGFFAKGYIPGGASLEQSPSQTDSPFTYCQLVGVEEGYRVARALLYSNEGLVKDIGQGVACVGKPSQELQLQRPGSRFTSFSTTTAFRVSPHVPSYPRGNGIFTKTFPGKIRSCTFTGSWITDNDQFNQRGSCHGAKGTFTGYADATQQYVINNPDLFQWNGLSQGALNPSEQRYEGYSFWMETCNAEYYRPGHVPKYGATGTLDGFGTNILAFVWNYFDEYARPAVDFSFVLDCQIQPSS